MKTTIKAVQGWAVRFGGLGLFLLALVFLAHAAIVDADQPAFGVLTRARGAVQYQAAGSTTWVRATERMRVNTGDKINTGPDGSAVIKLSAGNFINLHSNGQITIAAMTSRPATDPTERVLGLFPARTRTQNIEVDLARGRAVNVLRGLRAHSTYNLRTPVATAGVRGTVFSARVTYDRGVKQGSGNDVNVDFSCSEGSVEIEGNKDGEFDPVTLGEGQSLSLQGSSDGNVSGDPTPGQMTEEQVEEVQNMTDESEASEESSTEDQAVQDDMTDADDENSDNHHYYN